MIKNKTKNNIDILLINSRSLSKIRSKEDVTLIRKPNQMSFLDNGDLMSLANKWDQTNRKIWWEEEGVDVLRVDHWVRSIFYFNESIKNRRT